MTIHKCARALKYCVRLHISVPLRRRHHPPHSHQVVVIIHIDVVVSVVVVGVRRVEEVVHVAKVAVLEAVEVVEVVAVVVVEVVGAAEDHVVDDAAHVERHRVDVLQPERAGRRRRRQLLQQGTCGGGGGGGAGQVRSAAVHTTRLTPSELLGQNGMSTDGCL